MIMENKIFKSIDGLFENTLHYLKLTNLKKINAKRLSIVGKGNSISSLPYKINSTLIDLSIRKKIKLNSKKKTLQVSGNINACDIHNFLIKRKFFFPSFPSYPFVTVGACVANCTHGISPKFGIMKDYVLEIKLYNPNFGTKILSKSKNKKLFDLTIGGMGLTGIILETKLKVFKLRSTFLRIEKSQKFDDFKKLYIFLKNNNYIYNQNNIFLKFNNNKFLSSRISSGNFTKKDYKSKELNTKKINFLRLGILNYSFFRILLEKLILIKEYTYSSKLIHVNDAFFPSNARLIYFNLMPKKFMEHQVIIPHRNVKKFFNGLQKLYKKYSPTITLCHLKIFKGKAVNLQFNGNGLGLSIHFVINKNFKLFYKNFLNLNYINSCRPNLYKNSLLEIDDIKKFYKNDFNKFAREIKKINKKIYFENRLFNKENFYSIK